MSDSTRYCSYCKRRLPFSSFAASSCTYCKPCKRKYDTEWRLRNREKLQQVSKDNFTRRRDQHLQSTAFDDVMSEHEGDDERHLYIMRYEFDPCGTMGHKIGRTQNLAARVEQLERSHAFRMKVLRVYRGMGHLEPVVKELLASRRLHTGAGTEWYDVTFAAAMKAIALARSLNPTDDLQEMAAAFSELETSASE